MYQNGRAGDEAKSVSLPPKAGELASLLKPFLCYGYVCILLNVGPHKP